MAKNVIDIILHYRKLLLLLLLHLFYYYFFRIDKRKYHTFFITYMETHTCMSKSRRTGTPISLDGSWINILSSFCVTCVSLLLCIFKYYNLTRSDLLLKYTLFNNQYDFIVVHSVGCSFANRRVQRITAG